MTRLHLLDRLIGPDWPDLSTDKAVRAFEAAAYDERIAARCSSAPASTRLRSRSASCPTPTRRRPRSTSRTACSCGA